MLSTRLSPVFSLPLVSAVLSSAAVLSSVALLPSAAFAETRMMVPMSLTRIAVDTNPLSLPSQSQFKTLERRYLSGRNLDAGDLHGWYTGRCFFADSPSRAVASLLAADTDSFSATNGPAFKGPEYRHVTPLVDLTSSALKFDSMTGLADVDRVLRATRHLNAFPVRENAEMVVQGYRTTDLESRVYRLRKSGRFAVLRLECAEHDYCSNFSGWISNKFLAYEGEAVAYCYYFKKMK